MSNPHTDDRHPFWIVQGVFDPDGGGADFAYTIGLHERGVPELHVWARPALGDDPGEDWKFSLNDMTRLLNEFAWDWMAAKLKVGDVVERQYDADLVTVRFEVFPPEDREPLEAFGIAPEAEVIPIRWSLHRPPAGVLTAMSADDEVAAVAQFNNLRVMLAGLTEQLPGWEFPAEPRWDVDQVYGPRTPLVHARAAFLWTSDADDGDRLIDVGLCVRESGRLHFPIAAIRTAARQSGRHRELDRLEAAVRELVEAERHTLTQRFVAGFQPEEKERARDFAISLLCDMTTTALGAELVADLLPDDLRMLAIGPLMAGRLPPGVPADESWFASEEVRRSVDGFLSGIGASGVVAMSRCYAECDNETFLEVVSLLRAWMATSSCNWFPINGSLDPVFVNELERLRRPGEVVYLKLIAGCLAAILTYRMLLTADQVNAFVRPFAGICPGLSRLVNSPIASHS